MPNYQRTRAKPGAASPPPAESPELFSEPPTAPLTGETMAQVAATIDEAGLRAPGEAQPPAKRSLLAQAMDTVNHSVSEIERLGVTIDELEAKYPAAHKFDLTTPEGRKLADKVRADARKTRLNVRDMRKAGTDLLNNLKTQFWGVADPAMARLQGIEDNAKAQLDAHASIEADRKRKHEEAIAAIGQKALGASLLESAILRERIQSVKAIIVDDSYEEFQKQAEDKKAEVLQILQQALDMADAREAKEKAEADARAQQDAEAALAKIAKDKIAYWKKVATFIGNLEETQHELAKIPSRDNDPGSYGTMMADFVEIARSTAHDVLSERVRMLEAIVAKGVTVIDAPEVLPPAEEEPREPSMAEKAAVDPDPFTFTPPAPPAVSVSVTPSPMPPLRAAPARATPRAVPQPVPAPTQAPEPAEQPDFAGFPAGGEMSVETEDLPDLLKAAQDFVTTCEELGLMAQLADTYHTQIWPAYADLKRAVEIHSEFS